jgi:hypothetical protein
VLRKQPDDPRKDDGREDDVEYQSGGHSVSVRLSPTRDAGVWLQRPELALENVSEQPARYHAM